MVIKIERAQMTDVATLDRLRCDYALEMGATAAADPGFTTRLLAEPCVRVWLARLDGEAVGFAVVMELPDAIYRATNGMMDDLFVAAKARGRGIARALIQAAIDHGRNRDWAHLRWLVPEEDQSAIALYDRIGERVGLHSYLIRIDARRSV